MSCVHHSQRAYTMEMKRERVKEGGGFTRDVRRKRTHHPVFARLFQVLDANVQLEIAKSGSTRGDAIPEVHWLGPYLDGQLSVHRREPFQDPKKVWDQFTDFFIRVREGDLVCDLQMVYRAPSEDAVGVTAIVAGHADDVDVNPERAHRGPGRIRAFIKLGSLG